MKMLTILLLCSGIFIQCNATNSNADSNKKMNENLMILALSSVRTYSYSYSPSSPYTPTTPTPEKVDKFLGSWKLSSISYDYKEFIVLGDFIDEFTKNELISSLNGKFYYNGIYTSSLNCTSKSSYTKNSYTYTYVIISSTCPDTSPGESLVISYYLDSNGYSKTEYFYDSENKRVESKYYKTY
ncbi:MAG: hypothetical protein H7A24_17645 [Leptospiraceae bacterium]|nr:hypothetical protein [Leptospiraceae bacterium]MCP5513718.1 hypothetical protein [Leptospiraceae bacterium]